VPNVLTPNAKQAFFDNNGKPLVSGRLFTYASGTTTKIATKVSASGANNANPIVLDYRGECNVWVSPNTAYKYVLAPPGSDDPPTAPIWTVDAIVSSQLITLYGGVDTGSANNYILNFTSNFSSLTDGIIIYFLPANTNTGASILSVNGLGGSPIIYPRGGALTAGAIVANQMTTVMYLGGSWLLMAQAAFSSLFTGTLTGMTVATTGNVDYVISGGYCTLNVGVNITGTSNTTALSMTGLPAQVRPARNITVPCSALSDNGVSMNGTASIAGGTISFSQWTVAGTRVTDGLFTAAGTKGVLAGWTVTYPLS
jgi:hypothetical protein